MPPVATGPGFASELKAALDEREISVRAFARLYAGEKASANQVETARSNVSRWLRGDHAPTRRSRLRVARALEESPERFLDPDSEPTTPEQLEARLEELVELVDEGIARLEAGIARVEKRLARGDGRGRAK